MSNTGFFRKNGIAAMIMQARALTASQKEAQELSPVLAAEALFTLLFPVVLPWEKSDPEVCDVESPVPEELLPNMPPCNSDDPP